MEKLYKKGLRLEYFTVGYNIVEAAVSILFGHLAGSIALIGFGLDSIVESLSGLILIWRLRQHDKVSEEEEEKIQAKPLIQSQPLEEEEEIQTKPRLQMQPLEEEDAALQAKATGDKPVAADAAVETGIDRKKGKGQLLPPDTRSVMESRFGADFKQVNIHTDPAAVQMNRALNSQAFTVGNNIFFNAGCGISSLPIG